jgi:hypothetical protein
MLYLTRVIITIFTVLFSVSCWGAGVEYLGSTADAVVIASTVSGVHGSDRISLTLQVHRVLKGDIPPTLTVIHDWTGLWRGPDRAFTGKLTGMWFLTKKSADTWDILPSRPSMARTIHSLFLPADVVQPPGVSEATPLTERLVRELAAALRGSSGVDPYVLSGALDGVDQSVLAVTAPVLFALNDPGLQAPIVAALLARTTPDSIDQLVRLWPQIRASSHSRLVLEALSESWRGTDPKSLGQLADFASRNPDLKPAVAKAFAAIHTPATLPFLEELLFSPDADFQHQAMYGISTFANGCPMRTRETVVSMTHLICTQPTAFKSTETMANLVFRKGSAEDHQDRLAYWRTWVRANASALAAARR